MELIEIGYYAKFTWYTITKFDCTNNSVYIPDNCKIFLVVENKEKELCRIRISILEAYFLIMLHEKVKDLL